MKTHQIDLLNLGLILLSLFAAFLLPFELFLFSYAVLGPLHYITEISWLDERKYFSKSKYTPWILGGVVLVLCLSSFYKEGARHAFTRDFHEWVNSIFWAKDFFQMVADNYGHILFLALVIAIALTAFTDKWYRLMVVAMGIGIAMIFHGNSTWLILMSTMLPTIFHVSLFTGLFMLYGALKSESRVGLWVVLLFVGAHFIIAYFPIVPKNYFLQAGSYTANSIIESGFGNVMGFTAKFLGEGDGGSFVFNSAIGIRLGIFFAFIYTYHYLNWFSKTSLIGWHKVPRKKLIGGLLIWVASVFLYAYNYRVGLLSLLFLSLMHVVLEFPLNYISMRGIGEILWKKQGTTTNPVS